MFLLAKHLSVEADGRLRLAPGCDKWSLPSEQWPGSSTYERGVPPMKAILDEVRTVLAAVPKPPDPGPSEPPKSVGSTAPPKNEKGTPSSDWVDEIAAYKGVVDFAVITIKAEEEDAILRQFPRQHSVRGERDYGLTRTQAVLGGNLLVATVRQPRQGNTYATSVVKDVIKDLDPKWILLVGIAGASPFGDAVLGDVVLGTHVHDLTVHARNEDGSTTFSAGGGAATQDVESTVTHLRSTIQSRVTFPPLDKKVSLRKLAFTTEEQEVNERIQETLKERFRGGYAPRILDGQIISTDALVKDVDLVKQWSGHMRAALAIEMESAGAYNAARTRAKTYAMLPIRGISDIVGLKKREGWVLRACENAARCAFEFVRNGTPSKVHSSPVRSGPVSVMPTAFGEAHDLTIFRTSDALMSEAELTHVVDTVLSAHALMLRDGDALSKWQRFFDLVGNYYLTPALQSSAMALHEKLREWDLFIAANFFLLGSSGKLAMHPQLNVDREGTGDEADVVRYDEYGDQLFKLGLEVEQLYIAYRQSVKEHLFV